MTILCALTFALGLSLVIPSSASAQDRHEGYYYPPVTHHETYPARSSTAPEADRISRLGFVIGLTQEQMNQPYAPAWSVFVKGAEAEKMIIVAIEDGAIATDYQARAMLAQLTMITRGMPFFNEQALVDNYTFLDLLAYLGFEQLTVSDGRSYALQYRIEHR